MRTECVLYVMRWGGCGMNVKRQIHYPSVAVVSRADCRLHHRRARAGFIFPPPRLAKARREGGGGP